MRFEKGDRARIKLNLGFTHLKKGIMVTVIGPDAEVQEGCWVLPDQHKGLTGWCPQCQTKTSSMRAVGVDLCFYLNPKELELVSEMDGVDYDV